MKKTILALTSTLCVMASTLVTAAPTIEFNGEVSTKTCSPTINGNENGTVLLPTVIDTALAADGQAAGQTTFTIDLPGDCSSATGIVLAGYNVANGVLGNTAPAADAAKNVGLELLDSANKPIVLNGATNVPIKIVNEKASLGVQYKALGGAATTGLVKGTAEYTISYN